MRSTSTASLTIALAATTLLLSGCSKRSDEAATAAPGAAAEAVDAAASARNATPDIGVAPGVAFQYDYAFSLPAKAISSVQQQHAASCQRLGPSRCRITGMQYQQPSEDEVAASMNFLLAPDVAHAFGNDAVSSVEKADGKIEHVTVNGEDAGTAITLSQSNSAAIQAEAERIEARLKAKGLADQERADLTRRAEELREQLRGEAQTRSTKEQSLATTPVSFTYVSQGVIGTSGAFGKAASASVSGFANMTSVLALIIGYALPWLLPIGAGVLFWRYRKAKKLLASTVTAPSTAA